MEGKTKGLILVVLALIAFTAPAAAQNASEAETQIQVAHEAIQQMETEGVPTERAQSLLTTANNSYRAQQSLVEEGGEPDYSRTLELTDQIINMKETALRVNDRLNALENRINELENNSNLNLTDVRAAYSSVNQTFNNQRFSEAEDQVEQVYTEISEAQSVETQVQAFASAQQQNIAGMIENSINYATENWLTLLIGGTVFGGVLLVGGRELKLWRLKKKKESLLNEKQIVEKMVEEAQREYFVEGKGSKMSFETRMDKFQGMLRDTEESLNNVENEIERMEGLPVISPDIKARTEDFKEAGDVITESKEVKGSLERIRQQEEKEKEGTEEKDIEVIEDKKDSREKASDQEEEKKSDEEKPVEVKDTEEEENEKVNEYETLVNESTVKEAKARIEEIEDPDYEALMEAEKANKDRVTLERFLEGKIEEQEAEKEEEEKDVEVIQEEETEDEENEPDTEEKPGDKDQENEEESEEKPVEVKDTEETEEEEKIVDKGGKTVEEAGIEYVEADEDEEKDTEQESEENEVSAEKTIEEELGKAFASVEGEDKDEEDEYEEESEDLSEEKEVEVEDEEQDSGEEKISEQSEDSRDQEDSEEKPVEVKDTEEPSEDVEESSKETGSDEKESSGETDESGEDEEMEIIEEDGKYIDPETGKEFDTESAAKLFKQHFG